LAAGWISSQILLEIRHYPLGRAVVGDARLTGACDAGARRRKRFAPGGCHFSVSPRLIHETPKLRIRSPTLLFLRQLAWKKEVRIEFAGHR